MQFKFLVLYYFNAFRCFLAVNLFLDIVMWKLFVFHFVDFNRKGIGCFVFMLCFYTFGENLR